MATRSLRPLRWKDQYAHTDDDINQSHRQTLACFNQLIQAAGQREHCQEMEDFLSHMGGEVDSYLRSKTPAAACVNTVNACVNTVKAQVDKSLGERIITALPLQPYGSAACRNCGLCDAATANIAEHLQKPLDCLQHS